MGGGDGGGCDGCGELGGRIGGGIGGGSAGGGGGGGNDGGSGGGSHGGGRAGGGDAGGGGDNGGSRGGDGGAGALRLLQDPTRVLPKSPTHTMALEASGLTTAWKKVGVLLTMIVASTSISTSSSASAVSAPEDRVTVLHVLTPAAASLPKQTTAREASRVLTAL